MLKKGHNIISGDIGSGKSDRLLQAYLQLKKKGAKISGWITNAHVEDGKRSGYDIVFISDSVEAPPKRFIREHEFEGAFKWKRFWFDKAVFEEASMLVDSSLPEILIVDEVGPLELADHKGFWDILPKIFNKFETTITVVRTSCKQSLMEQFKKIEFFVIEK